MTTLAKLVQAAEAAVDDKEFEGNDPFGHVVTRVLEALSEPGPELAARMASPTRSQWASIIEAIRNGEV